MYCGHESLFYPECVVNHFSEWRETVSSAGGVRNHVHGLLHVPLLVHTHHKHGGVCTGRGNDHLLRATHEVS